MVSRSWRQRALVATEILAFPAATLAADAPQTAKVLDPVRRTYLLMALVGLVLIGALLIFLTTALARQARRHAQKRFGPTPLPRDDDWYRKPLVPRGEKPAEEEPES